MGLAAKKPVFGDLSDEQVHAPFLGVSQSARGMRWSERLKPGASAIATAISQQHGLPEVLGRILAARDVTSDDVPVFLEPTLKSRMPDPSLLQDMDKAARRLAHSIEKGERVGVFGDYDVDGACSSALMARFLAKHNCPCEIYIPDRLREGYGPNTDALNALADNGAGLVVTVDCGTMSFDPFAAMGARGVDVVVVDHHQADEVLPEVVALVNPNRQDDVSGQGHLCAAGVVFLVLVAVTRELRVRGFYDKSADVREPSLLDDLDLVALATVCDVVPLVGLNRAYVRKGIEVMRRGRNRGLRALFDTAGLDQAPTPYHLGFILGPRINAGGRIGDSGLGARLLSLADNRDAVQIAERLDKLNRDRKAIETRALEEAMTYAQTHVEEDPDIGVLVVGSADWHKGIVGLVASRLTERFHRPSCVISWTADASTGKRTGTASLRSVAGVDIGGAVRAAVNDGLLVKGGGHAMAAGLTVEEDKLPALQEFFADAVKADASAARETAALEIDGSLTPKGAGKDLVGLLERAGPFGQGNPQPRFAFPAHRVKFAKVVGGAHVRCSLEAADGSRIDGIAFRAAGQPLGELLLAAGGFPIHVCGTLRRDTWGGRDRVEMMIEDAADPRAQA